MFTTKVVIRLLTMSIGVDSNFWKSSSTSVLNRWISQPFESKIDESVMLRNQFRKQHCHITKHANYQPLVQKIQKKARCSTLVTCDLMSTSHYEPFKIWQMTWRVEWSILIGSGRPIPTSIIPRHEMRQWAKNKRAFQNRELGKVISTTGGPE